MPRDTSGNYSLPVGTLVNSGDTIEVSQHNPAMSDIAAALGNSLDRDGTGGMRQPLNMGGNKIRNASPGTDPTDVAIVSQLSNSSFPPGCIIDFAGQAAPDGWLVCGGQSVSRSTYSALFGVIGTSFGSADGGSFNLPDLRGRVTAGRDFSVNGSTANRLSSTTIYPSAGVVAGAGGSEAQTLTEAQMPSHTHTGSTASAGSHSHTVTGSFGSVPVPDGSPAYGAATEGSVTTSADGAHTHAVSVSASGGGQAHPNVQPTIILNKIIKV